MSDNLFCISPIDGRYAAKTKELQPYFSEFGLFKYRTRIEIEYLVALSKLEEIHFSFNEAQIEALTDLYKNFTLSDAEDIKSIEEITNHDVKAVEYFIKKKLDTLGLQHIKEFVHFGLTSQDINNSSIPLLLKESVNETILPGIVNLMEVLERLSRQWKELPMLAKTHGQPASPTTLGKELFVFHARLSWQLELLYKIPFSAKLGGATGNFNAHKVAFPSVNWIDFATQFLKDLGLERSHPTTQIEHYDNLAALCDTFKRISTILIDLCRDIWQYISMNYFSQKINKDEVGSSAMPHKVNPIDFENAEGNLGLAIALFEHFAHKLPISRLQRDLTDSTVLRNLGVPFAHFLISLKSIEKGLNKLELNQHQLKKDLDDNWAVISEAIQTILRRENYPSPYEKLKELTRTGKKIGKEDIKRFIANLDVEEEVKSELNQITPFNYVGYIF